MHAFWTEAAFANPILENRWQRYLAEGARAELRRARERFRSEVVCSSRRTNAALISSLAILGDVEMTAYYPSKKIKSSKSGECNLESEE